MKEFSKLEKIKPKKLSQIMNLSQSKIENTLFKCNIQNLIYEKIPIITVFYLINSSLNAEVINKILINNNERISDETIITYGQIEIGKDYNNKINEILKNLYGTDFFNNISLKIENSTLIIDVEENQIIQSVVVEGVEFNDIKKSILKNLYSKDKAPFLIEKVKADKIRILNSLNTSGYYLANVDVEIKNNLNKTIDLIFNIDLGEKAVISKIEFVGDKKIKDRTLRNIITSENQNFGK